MTTSIVVLTSNEALSRFVGIKKSAIVPVEIRNKPCFREKPFAVSSVLVRELGKATEILANYFVGIPESTEALIVLCEKGLEKFAAPFARSFFTYFFDPGMGGKTVQNYLGYVCARVLSAFAIYSSRFDDAKYRRLMLLPTRNFKASEIKDLEGLFLGSVKTDDFGPKLDGILARIRKRQKPKRESTYDDVYIVDDSHRHFIYGKERHSQNETSCPPHGASCLTSGHFRFGRRYDSGRHYNVSYAGWNISGMFASCHDAQIQMTARSHINMFPNDFFGKN